MSIKQFSQLAEEWLESHMCNIKKSTYAMYVLHVTQLNQVFSNTNIDKITYTDIQQYMNNMYRNGKSKSSIEKAKITISQVIQYAKKLGYVSEDVSKLAKIPKNAKVTRRRSLTDDEISVIYQSNALYPLVLLLLGLRRSEAAALKYQDIDFNRKAISVNKVVNWNGNVPELHYFLKNGEEERVVPIPSILIDKLKPSLKSNGYIFANEQGGLLTASQMNNLWYGFIRKCKLDITQHMLRHTYATMLYRSGVDIKTAQYLLGHKDIAMIMQIYTHMDIKTTVKNIDKFNHFFETNFV